MTERAEAGDRNPDRRLLRVLGLAFALAVVIGSAVGQGIMRAPGTVAGQMITPWAILAVWAAGGLLAMLDAFAVAELGAALPRAGGAYAFAGRAFGTLPATLTGWADVLNGVLANAFIAAVFAEYLHRLGIAGSVPQPALAVALLLVCGAINAAGTRTTGASQTLGTLVKAALLTAIVVALFLVPRGEAPGSATLSPATGIAALAIALRATVVTYFGWHYAVVFGEEIENPQANMPRSLFGGLALITLLYVSINAGLLHALPVEAVASSNLPAADALAGWGEAGTTLVTALALVSLFAIVNLGTMQFPRITYAMARDGALPAIFTRVSPGGTPRPALLLTIVGGAVFALSGTYEQLIAATAVTGQGVLVVIDAAAIRLRRTEPGLARPFRMPWYPWPAVLGIAVNCALIAALIWEDPVHSVIGVGILAIIASWHGLVRFRRPSRRDP